MTETIVQPARPARTSGARPAGVSAGARNSQRRLILDTLLLGIAGAVAAQLFTVALRIANRLLLSGIAGYVPPGLASEGGLPHEVVGSHGLWLVPVSTTLGGLIVGVLIGWLAPEAEGHGTDTAVQAFHRADGALRARVPPLKLLASAITIGSGGSAGREGPIALVTAGVGSWYATVTGRSGRERRLLVLVGMAAGLSAIFRSPVGSAILAIEVLYADMEFESGALLYTMLAAILAYALTGFVTGWEPLFRIPPIAPLGSPPAYLWYVLLGVLAGVAATVVPTVFYGVRDAFRRLPLHPYLKPALGGLLTGLVALAVPQVIGGGYGWMQQAIDGRLALGLLVALVLTKTVAMSLTVASGGSGGVFAPTLFVGAMLGGACAAIAHEPPAGFVIVGMASVFAGAARVPIATLMMVTEMTGGYTLLVPAALAVMLSYLVQSRLSASLRHYSLYEGQVANRADSPAHHAHHLEIALRILRRHELPQLSEDAVLELLPLLRSGVPVALPGGRRLVVGVLRGDSEVVGTTVEASGRHLGGEGTNILGIIRGEHMLAPRPDTVFLAGDRLIYVAGAEALVRGRGEHLRDW